MGFYNFGLYIKMINFKILVFRSENSISTGLGVKNVFCARFLNTCIINIKLTVPT